MSFRASLVVLSLFLVPLAPSGALAQQPAATATPATTGATVHGLVTDPDEAVVPNATVTLTPASGKAQTTTSKSDGTYTFRGVSAGTYVVTVTAPGFGVFVKEAFHVGANANVPLDAKLAIADFQQQMTVSAESVNLSVDPENNASTTVISGAALDALSDDPDELSAELSALAGPSAGPGGGQIYIDGFTGGQLPPKSSIREIRINSNPFSAQYDQLGYGRIEIFTKPGTDKFHGNASFQYNEKFLNTSTPFLGPANSQPDYHTIFLMGSVTGPIRKGMSFTLSGSHRDIAQNDISNPTDIYSADGVTLCQPGDLTHGCTSIPLAQTLRAVANPQTRSDVSPRVDIALGAKNTLTVRYQYEQGSSNNNLTSTIGLPTTTTNGSNSESTLQVSDSQLLSNKVINETRFEYQHTNTQTLPTISGTNVSVSGDFSTTIANPSTTPIVNHTPGDHIEVQNYTSIQLTKNFIRVGGRYRTSSEAVSQNTGINGSITYRFLLDPCTDPNQSATNKANCLPNLPSTATPCATGNMIAVPGSTTAPPPLEPLYSSYQCATPFQFTQTTIHQITVNARESDVGLYAEDDWKAKNNLTISVGVRLEAQNYISSGHDFAPRMSIAYGIPRKNGKTTTVLRGGYGIFYNRFSLGSIFGLIQNGGTLGQVQGFINGSATPNQVDSVYSNPANSCVPTNITTCSAGTSGSGRIDYQIEDPNLRSSYISQAAGTIEQQVGKFASVTATFLNARGDHQFLSRTIPTTTASGATAYEQFSSSGGVFRQTQAIFSTNIRTPYGIQIFGNYSLNWADSNISSITDPYNPHTDYGRAAFAIRQRLNLGGTIPLPWHITASPLIFANAGSPYNLTTGVDNNLDGVTDDRPAFQPGMTSGSCTNASTFTVPTPSSAPRGGESYQQIPVNYCTGPANVAINLRLSRTFGFGPKTDAALAAAARQAAGGGPGGGGGRPGGGGGMGAGPVGGGGGGGGARGGGGGGGGGRGGGGANTGRKYNLTIGAQAQNLFNEIPYGTPVSTLSSTDFGKPITLQGMPFASANAVRRITLQANFSF
jgi:Carboxypeptidase regulatory-like domain